MIATKLTPSQVNIKVTGITLLTVEEARKIPVSLRKNNYRDWRLTSQWWLRTPGTTNECVAYVRPDGKINTEGEYANNCISIGVRPALIVENLSELNIGRGSQLRFAGFSWTVVNGTKVLCDDIIGTMTFRNYFQHEGKYYRDSFYETPIPAEEINDYEHSCIKEFLNDWVNENGLQIESEAA